MSDILQQKKKKKGKKRYTPITGRSPSKHTPLTSIQVFLFFFLHVFKDFFSSMIGHYLKAWSDCYSL